MHGLRIKSRLPKTLRNLVGNHHRSVPAARAANSHGQIGLSLTLILRQEVIQQISKATQRLLNFRLVFQILHDPPISAGQRSQAIDKKWVGQVANIKQQLHVSWCAKPVTETEYMNAQRNGFAAMAEAIQEQTP